MSVGWGLCSLRAFCALLRHVVWSKQTVPTATSVNNVSVSVTVLTLTLTSVTRRRDAVSSSVLLAGPATTVRQVSSLCCLTVRPREQDDLSK